jgi:hypothetical protein
MMLDERKTEILKAVAAGTRSFQADDDSDAARTRFQFIARAVVELERDGYLKGVRTVRENETGQRYIDSVSVEGLTPKGRRYMESVR